MSHIRTRPDGTAPPRRRARRRVAAALVAPLVLVATGWGEPPAGSGPGGSAYRDPASWLCRPDQPDDLCHGGQDATVVPADGRLREERWRRAVRPPVDCFYVYGTVSDDPGLNSDLDWSQTEEGQLAQRQAARLGASCRVFAPAYRQVTATALADGRWMDPAGTEVAYASVLDAWRYYLARHSGGRGFVLLGHSQGAFHVARLLRQEIEADPELHARLVGAYVAGLVGGPAGDVGELATPVCTEFAQVGCRVPWATYRSTDPPGPNALFGRDGDLQPAPCANPAALTDPRADPGERRWLTPYLPAAPIGAPRPGPWVDPSLGTVDTPFVTPVHLVEGRCVEREGIGYLEVTVHGDPADPRVDDIGGDWELPGLVTRSMTGLHLLDVEVLLGDLVRLVQVQGRAYLQGR